MVSITNKQNEINKCISKLESKLRAILQKFPDDDRKILLQQLVEQMCRSIELQATLILVEEKGRFVFSEPDYHELLDAYLPLFNEMKTLPRLHKGSIYEIAIVSDLDTVLKCHCEGENLE